MTPKSSICANKKGRSRGSGRKGVYPCFSPAGARTMAGTHGLFRPASRRLVLDLENAAAGAEIGAYAAQEGYQSGGRVRARFGGAGEREAAARRPASGAGDAQRAAQRVKLDVEAAAGAAQPRHMRAEIEV